MIAIIQAGGAGTRLKDITGDLPKPMVEIGGKPILEWQIENLRDNGVEEIIIVISKDNGGPIKDYFADGEGFEVSIRYIEEETPLGTAGSLFYAAQMVDDDCIICFGDLMLDINWQKFIDFHVKKGGALTAFAHPNSHPFDSDLLVTNKDDRIIRIDPKGTNRNYFYENLTNAGLYIANREVLKSVTNPLPTDFESVVLTNFVANGKAYAYRSSEYVKDCGTPDRYYDVINDCEDGIISAKNLSKPQKCIFLDRDGTINTFGDFVTNAGMLELVPDAAEAIKMINESEYLAICITNQPVVARGETTFDELANIHNKMEDLLGQGGAFLNDLYFCPHHPDGGYPGEVPELKIVCDCRKPKIGLLLRAQDRYNIDFSASWFVGDTKQDVQTGINAGCRTVLLTSGDPRNDDKYPNAMPTMTCGSLKEAITAILGMKKD
jgi:histidinol-phosphate phosphatase family protein